MSSLDVDIGQRIYAIGTPRGMEATITDGIISSIRIISYNRTRLQISAPIAHGSSGGPIFDENGNLIGIAVSGMDASYAQNMNFAIPVKYLENDLKSLADVTIEGQKLPNPPNNVIIDNSNWISQNVYDDFLRSILKSTNHEVLFEYYQKYYAKGANEFNQAAASANVSGFLSATIYFMKSEMIGQYIRQKKWANIGTVDTTLVLNIAKAALNAKNDDVAREYFKKLADAHIIGLFNPKGTADISYELPYQWLTLDYKNAKDEVNMLKYAELGKAFFPNDDYFDFVEMDYFRESRNHPSLFKKYDEITNKHPDSLRYHLNYATEIFSYIYNSDEGTVIDDKDALLATLQNQLEKTHSLDPNNSNVNLLYSQYYYNRGIIALENAQKIIGSKLTPDQIDKKSDLSELGRGYLEKAIPYAEATMKDLETGFKKTNKSIYKSAVNLLQDIYMSLNDKGKLKFYQKKYDQSDDRFVN